MSQDKKSEFESLLADSLKEGTSSIAGQIVEGVVVDIKNDKAMIDIGMKSEGILPVNDIKLLNNTDTVKIGDKVTVYVEKSEDKFGNPLLNIEKGKKEALWLKLEKCMATGEPIDGIITGKTKGGFSVNIDGTEAFLPGSQLDVRLIKDVSPLINTKQQFKVIKMDRSRNNIVVSRKAVMLISQKALRDEILSNLKEGMVLEGVVKNITEYGAFVDIGGIDGLLHITDISWSRISSPSDVMKIGDTIKVQVVKFNKESGRVSLGIKQLTPSPWTPELAEKYKIGEKYKGKIVNLTDYGAFVELENAIEGIVYKSELTWNRSLSIEQAVHLGDEVEVQVLEVNPERHKISLSIKNCFPNPCVKFVEDHPVGEKIKCTIKSIREFGIFVNLTDTLTGVIGTNDIKWDIRYDYDLNKGKKITKKSEEFTIGQEIDAVVLGLDVNKEIVKLGIKQLEPDPYKEALETVKKDDVVKGQITEVGADGIEVKLNNGLLCLVKKTDLGLHNKKYISEYNVGDEIDAIVVSVNIAKRYVLLSIKALELKTEKDVLKKLNMESNKSTLGDIIGDKIK